jgi:segregation and condensation protein B
MANLKLVIEALLFASQKPISPTEIGAALKLAADYFEEGEEAALGKSSEAQIAGTLIELQREYGESKRAFQLIEQVSGWAMVSRPEYQVWVRQLFPEMRPTRLSPPALETLAIIAYRQPITKANIEAIRGVAVDGVLQKLLDAGLVKIAGRAEVPGRPLLYQTTQHFMEHFGLRNLDELPNAAELRQLPLPATQAEEPEIKPLDRDSEREAEEVVANHPSPVEDYSAPLPAPQEQTVAGINQSNEEN